MGQKITDLTQTGRFWTRVWVPRSHLQKKNRQFWPELSVSGMERQFKFTVGFKMMHKAWRSIEEVPYCFSRSSIKFQGQTDQKKSTIRIQFE